jgi:hypothetical protein
MKQQIATASRIIHAAPAQIYEIIADYRTMHPMILPKTYFSALEVEQGGSGEGTIVNFRMRLLGQTRSFRAAISEPQPGQVLQETDLDTGAITQFRLSPLEGGHPTRVTISTELKALGELEVFFGKMMLEKVYRQELELLARLAEEHALLKFKSA